MRTTLLALLLVSSAFATIGLFAPTASACIELGNPWCNTKCFATPAGSACAPYPSCQIGKPCTDAAPTPPCVDACVCTLCKVWPILACNEPNVDVGAWAGFTWTSCVGGNGYVCTDPVVRLPSRLLPGGVWCGGDTGFVLP